MTTDNTTTAAVPPPVSRAEWWVVGSLTAAFLAVVALWCVLAPIYDAPDEPLHLNSAIRLAEGGGWPAPGTAEVQNMVTAARAESSLPADQRSTFAELESSHPGYKGVDQMTQHPPLYYAYAAVVLRAIDFMHVRADQALLAVRLAGLLFALPLPALAWASVRRLTRSPASGVLAAAALFAVPQLAHIMGSVSNDGLTIVLSSAVVWLTIRHLTGDTRWWVPVATGAALALALFTKGTAVPLIPFVLAGMLIWPRTLAVRGRLLRAAATMAIALGGGWWWIRNLIVYHTLQPAGLVYPSAPWPDGKGPDPIAYLNAFWNIASSSFWGNFGWLTHAMPAILTAGLTAISLFVIAGWAFRRSEIRGRLVLIAALPVFFLLALLTQTWPTYVRTTQTPGLQGRYFFVVLIPLLVLSAVAWRRMVQPAERRTTGTILLSAFALIACIGVWIEVTAAYPTARAWLALTPAGAGGAAVSLVVAVALSAFALVRGVRFIRDTGPRVSGGSGRAPRAGRRRTRS